MIGCFQYDGEGPVDIMLTETQRNYYNTLKRLGARKPKKTVKRPKVLTLLIHFSLFLMWSHAIVIYAQS